MVPKRLRLCLWIFLLCITGCKKNIQIARPPITTAPSVVYQGPATELENQSTSTPIIVRTLPEPTSSASDVKPSIPLPATRPSDSKPTKPLVEPKKEIKLSPPVETRNALQTPAIQLAPQINENEKISLIRKINDQLDSAKSLIKSVNESSLNENQRTNLAAIQDFIRKAEDAKKRGEFEQGLVLARKANTLAASIVNLP